MGLAKGRATLKASGRELFKLDLEARLPKSHEGPEDEKCELYKNSRSKIPEHFPPEANSRPDRLYARQRP